MIRPDVGDAKPRGVRAALVPLVVAGAASFLLTPPAAAQETDGQGYFDRPIPPDYCQPNDERTAVLLLGSYHMANPGRDAFNLEADDVLTPQRQAEIQALVERLERFRADVVAVEARWGDTVTTARYRAYVAGERELGRNETEQIGFRLAHRLGHERVYPIDVSMGLDFEAVGRTASEDPRLAAKLGQMQAVGEEAIALMAARLAESGIGSMLRWMNEPDNLRRAHMIYLDFFVPVVVGENYAGADMVAAWYQRNLRVFANLTRIAIEPGSRVFVVFGQGHIPILRQAVIDHPAFCVEDPLPYLEGL